MLNSSYIYEKSKVDRESVFLIFPQLITLGRKLIH